MRPSLVVGVPAGRRETLRQIGNCLRSARCARSYLWYRLIYDSDLPGRLDYIGDVESGQFVSSDNTWTG